MELIPLKTFRLAPGEDLVKNLNEAFKNHRQTLDEGDILVIASKAVAYSEGRVVPEEIEDGRSFADLVREESDVVLAEGDMVLTLKNNILIPNAGIDHSNAPNNKVVLWPADPFKAAQKLCAELKQKWNKKNLGIVLSDSHCVPLRAGTTGIAIAWAGFEGIEDVRGHKDLYGKLMKYTKIAVADNLASAANLLMGETDACTPYVIVRGYKAAFNERLYSPADYSIAAKDCIFSGIYKESFLRS